MADAPSYPRVAAFKTADAFRRHLRALGLALDFDDALAPPSESPLARPIDVDGVRVGNRFCVLPMEGWDGTAEGSPSELTTRRWRRFGASGAKLVWGGEAVAVRQDGRANPNQLLLTARTQSSIARLREDLVVEHRERFGPNADRDLHVGLQLTHSGRYSRPSRQDLPEPLVAYHHPMLDRRFRAGVRVLTDDELDVLVEDFVCAAKRAADAGFAFVDIKHCHGYLGHELLSAHTRPGRYGGSFENRTRFLRSVTEGIRAHVPGLGIAVRLSAFDTVPYKKDATGVGIPEDTPEAHGFGLLRGADMNQALDEARLVLRELERLDIRLACITAGSPYYNPHVQRPALFPPSDGYAPPEDPLAGVARQIDATARLKRDFPALIFVGSAYTYLQEWLPHVAQYAVGHGLTDFVGLGRMVLAYPELPSDVLAGRPLRRNAICRTFSECTTGPRLGLASGCYPLDPFYAEREEAAVIKAYKAARGRNGAGGNAPAQ